MPFDSAALRSGRTVHTWHLWAHLRQSFLRRQEPSAPAHQALPVIPANPQRGARAETHRPRSSSFCRHSCEGRNPAPLLIKLCPSFLRTPKGGGEGRNPSPSLIKLLPSFLRRQEPSALAHDEHEALDPCLRRNDELGDPCLRRDDEQWDPGQHRDDEPGNRLFGVLFEAPLLKAAQRYAAAAATRKRSGNARP